MGKEAVTSTVASTPALSLTSEVLTFSLEEWRDDEINRACIQLVKAAQAELALRCNAIAFGVLYSKGQNTRKQLKKLAPSLLSATHLSFVKYGSASDQYIHIVLVGNNIVQA